LVAGFAVGLAGAAEIGFGKGLPLPVTCRGLAAASGFEFG
jgi:hypothetical protein